MPVGTDIFDAFERAAHIGLLIAVIFVICVVCLRRTRARRRGGYASYGSIGFAMQQLQALAKSPIEHQLEEQRQEKLDEDDEGGPDDPVRYYRRLRKKVDESRADEEKNLETEELANSSSGCNNARGMKLTINGNDREFTGPLTLAALIGQLDMKEDRVAVELNRNIVTRDQWPQTSLAEGDRLEIVHFVGGGLPHHFFAEDEASTTGRT